MKKRLALLLTVVMMLSLALAACTSSGDPTNPPATTATNPGTSDTPATTDPGDPGNVDTGLTDPNVAAPGTIPVLNELTQITVGVGTDSSSASWKQSAAGDWVKERTNVDIVWEFFSATSSESRQAIELLVASNAEMPEILLGILNDAGRDSYGEQGYLVELTPYFEKQGQFFYDKVAAEGFDLDDMTKYAKSPDGGLYGVPSFGLAVNNYYSNRAWVATPFLEALEMDNPTTADELYDFLTAVKSTDVNGNGKNDEIGIIGSKNGWNGNPLRWLQNMFIYCDNTDDGYIVENGVLDVAYDKAEYREFLQYARKLADEGLLDPLSFTQDYDTFLGQITAEDVIVAVAIAGGVGGFGDNVTKYDAANVIEGPSGLKVATYAAPMANTTAYITHSAKSPEACFAFLMIGFSDAEYDIIGRYGIEGTDWEYYTGTEPGMYDAIGYPATIKWLRGDIRTVDGQTSVWGQANVTQLPIMTKIGMQVYADPTEPSNRGAVMTADITAAQMPYAPDEVVVKIIFTKEESEQIDEQRSVLRTFVKESATRFVAGDLDPNKDSDWDTYMNELNTIGYQDYLAVARAAYTRTISD